MDLRNQRRVPYVDAGRGENRGQMPEYVETRPMVTIPPPQPVIGYIPPGVEYANDPLINDIIQEAQRRRRTRVPLMPDDDLRGRRSDGDR